VEIVERENEEKSWTLDFINYQFETIDGFIFTGVNEANSSETENLIQLDNSVTVEYVRSNPNWHRLKGWGYGGLGPPGSLIFSTF